MTEKDIKDYCKNCDVEPPAMRFKCPECEHNPDKEQIICKYKFQDKEKFNGKPYCTCFNELCEDLSFVCDHNCQIYEDYTQLARKTQECEELKSELHLYKTWYRAKHGDFKNTLGIYCKALEEIEEYCIHYLKHNPKSPSIDLNVILDIINKAKE